MIDQQDDDRFESAVSNETPRLIRLAYTILRNREDAEDAVQETLTQAWRARAKLREPAAVPRWLSVSCVRQCLRRKRARSSLSFGSASIGGGELTAPLIADPDVDLERALRVLSLKQRAVLSLHYHYGYSLDECAGIMGSRPGTVRSHLGRALAKLREELDDD